MQKLVSTLALALLAIGFQGSVFAADASCADKAVSKSGKPLAGAAKTAFMKKCEADGAPAASAAPAASGCADKAVGKNGKPLAGAAKKAFLKKCEADAKPAN